MKKYLLCLIILTLTASPTGPAAAQAYRSQLSFLEKFAIRQYERGDRENARKQFGWILRIEPGNTVAKEYLRKIEEQSGGNAGAVPENRTQVLSDISSVRKDLAEYEKDARELEGLIRDMITENDALYQALYKRSREVAEMRQKFYGTPYEKAYFDAMKDVPIDRVPQRLHSSRDILPEDASIMSPAEAQEINAILKDIAELSEQQTGTSDPSALDTALRAKRDMLIDKTRTLAEKRDSLNRLKNELSNINTGLKNSNNAYIDAIKKIDAYYNSFKEKLAKKNFVEQKMFSELVSDYAEKVREIEELKKSVRTQDNSLTAFKPDISSANDRLRDIDTRLKEKDAELVQFKDQIAALKEQLGQRDAALQQRNTTIRDHETTIQRQENGLLMTDSRLEGVTAGVSDIEAQLRTGDAQLAKLKETAAQLKNASRSRTSAQDLADKITRLNTQLAQAQQEIINGKAREDALITRIKTLEKENISVNHSLLEAKTENMAGSKALAEAKKRIELLTNSLSKTTAAPAQAPQPPKDQAAEQLQRQLMERDAMIKDLQASLRTRADDKKNILADELEAKNDELAALQEKLTALQKDHDLALKALAQTAAEPLRADQVRQMKIELAAKDEKIREMQQALISAKDAEIAAELRMKAFEERYTLREIKQDAIDKMIKDRDVRIAELTTMIEALRREVGLAEEAGQANLAKAQDADAAKTLAEKELQANTGKVSKLNGTVRELVSDIRAAKALVEKKSRDHDATLRELRRLSELLDQKKEEVEALQRRANADSKKAAAPAQPDKVTAPDCFKDCPAAVK